MTSFSKFSDSSSLEQRYKGTRVRSTTFKFLRIQTLIICKTLQVVKYMYVIRMGFTNDLDYTRLNRTPLSAIEEFVIQVKQDLLLT